MTEFNNIVDSLRRRLPEVLGMVLLALIVTGELVFALVQIPPAVRTHNLLSSQLAEARQAFSPPAQEGEIEATLQAQLTTMQETFNEQAGVFLAESEVPVVVNHLYRYAEESGVQITQITAARGGGSDTSEGAAHEVQSFQVEVSGSTLSLIDFVTRLQEVALPTIVIDHLIIQQGKSAAGVSMLTMDLHFYTSPYATGEASTMR